MSNHGFLLIDKPQGWTSHDVVAKMRRVFDIKKIGHMGTLDPLATGLLVLAVGREATKQIQHYMKLDKAYEVDLEFGKASDTYDSEGQVELTASASELSALQWPQIEQALEGFWGKTLQTPPAFSAKKIGGRPAYKLARAGKKVELKAREVTMQGSDFDWAPPFLRFHLEVSSGTYVRSLVHDLGQTLEVGAIMTALRRTRVGDFHLEHAHTIEDLVRAEDPFGFLVLP